MRYLFSLQMWKEMALIAGEEVKEKYSTNLEKSLEKVKEATECEKGKQFTI